MNKDQRVQLADVVDVQHKGQGLPACWFSAGIREFTLFECFTSFIE